MEKYDDTIGSYYERTKNRYKAVHNQKSSPNRSLQEARVSPKQIIQKKIAKAPTRGQDEHSSSNKSWLMFAVIVFVSIMVSIYFVPPLKTSTKKGSVPPLTSQKYSQASYVTSPPPSIARNVNMQNITYTEPPIGINNILSLPQIRWCLREQIRVDTMRVLINSNIKVKKFNKIVSNYNQRCSKYRYKIRTLQVAKQEVETQRHIIVDEAKKYISRPYSKKLVQDIQHSLKALGYDPGPVDGLIGARTMRAVRAFQRDEMLLQEDKIDEYLLSKLQSKQIIKLYKKY